METTFARSGARAVALACCFFFVAQAAPRAQTRTDADPQDVTPVGAPLEAHALRVGAVEERDIAAGQVVAFEASVPAGHFFHASVRQIGVDVAVRLVSPAGEPLATIDSPTGTEGVESVSLVADVDGDYRFEVDLPEGSDPASGRVVVAADSLRPATDQDRAQVAAERAACKALSAWLEDTEEGYKTALSGYSEALVQFQKAGIRSSEADTLSNIAAIALVFGDSKKALATLQQEVAIRRAIDDEYGLAVALNNTGEVYKSSSRMREALEQFSAALPLAENVENGRLQATTLVKIAEVESFLGLKDSAATKVARAIPLLEASDDRAEEAQARTLAGQIANDLGLAAEARGHLQKAVLLWRGVGDRGGLASALLSLGSCYHAVDEKQQALDTLREALAVGQSADDPALVARILYTTATLYGSLGDRQTAKTLGEKAVADARAVGDRRTLAQTLHSLGWTTLFLSESRGDVQRSLGYLREALALRRSLGDLGGEARTLTNLGDAFERLGQRTTARQMLNQALAIDRKTGAKREQGHVLWLLGRGYAASGSLTRASHLFDDALAVSREVGDRGSEAMALYQRAKVRRRTGDLQASRADIEAALDVVETLRGRLGSSELRAYYLAEVFQYYEFYIDLLMQLHAKDPRAGFDAGALGAVERSRARGFVELLAQSGTTVTRGVDPVLLDRLHTVQRALGAKSDERLRVGDGSRGGADVAAINRDLESLGLEYETVLARIRASSPGFADLVAPRPLDLAGIQHQVLDEGTVLLEYSLGEKRGFLFVVSAGSLATYELPARARIEALARRVHTLVATRRPLGSRDLSLDADLDPTMRRDLLGQSSSRQLQVLLGALGRMVLGPARSALDGRRVVVVADGALQYIPFGALTLEDEAAKKGSQRKQAYRPLIADCEVLHAPSASAIAVLRSERRPRETSKTLAVVADPVFSRDDERFKAAKKDSAAGEGADLDLAARDTLGVGRSAIPRLKFTREEANAILALVASDERFAALDFVASREWALSHDPARYRMVHFATHGLLDAERPMLSGLVLSMYDEQGNPTQGFLRTSEVFNMELGADLVVLSACQTGLGKNIRGEGLVGLTRAFLYAGASRVVVSLWSVDDEATSHLMAQFYRATIKEGKTPAAALREAQLALLNDPKWAAPYFWAAFAIQGDWR